MGEAPAFIGYEVPKHDQSGCIAESNGLQAITIYAHNKSYIIGGENADKKSIGVRIFDTGTGDLVEPVVLGTRPAPCKGHFAVLLDEARIIVLRKGTDPDDAIWFLEVDTPYIRQQQRVLGTEVVAWSKGARGGANKPLVVSGPSGVGKGTLISMLMKDFPSMFGFSVSHTTRAPRKMEREGVHYHFTDRSFMEQEIKDGKFLEFASVHGNLYGTSVESVELVADSGKTCVLDIDVQGAKSVKASPLDATFIFISPPSMEALEKRLRSRGTESEEQILKRLRNAKAEIEQGSLSGIFDHILYNDNLEECYENLKKILGLEGSLVTKKPPSSVEISLPENFSVSKCGSKVVLRPLKYQENESCTNLIVLDTLSLTGGAPGRTRGLNMYAVDSFSGDLNDIK